MVLVGLAFLVAVGAATKVSYVAGGPRRPRRDAAHRGQRWRHRRDRRRARGAVRLRRRCSRPGDRDAADPGAGHAGRRGAVARPSRAAPRHRPQRRAAALPGGGGGRRAADRGRVRRTAALAGPRGPYRGRGGDRAGHGPAATSRSGRTPGCCATRGSRRSGCSTRSATTASPGWPTGRCSGTGSRAALATTGRASVLLRRPRRLQDRQRPARPRRRRPAARLGRAAAARRGRRTTACRCGSAATSSRSCSPAPTPTRRSWPAGCWPRSTSRSASTACWCRPASASPPPLPGATVDSVLRDADVAMYTAKQRGKASFVRYVDGMGEPVLAHMQLGGELRRALDDDELRVVYQPILRLRRPAGGRRRGAGPLAPPDPRRHLPGRVHPGRRTHRPDRAAGPVRAARDLPPGRRVAVRVRAGRAGRGGRRTCPRGSCTTPTSCPT